MAANKSYEYVEKYRYLNTTLTNQNYVHEEIKSRLNSLNSFLPFGPGLSRFFCYLTRKLIIYIVRNFCVSC